MARGRKLRNVLVAAGASILVLGIALQLHRVRERRRARFEHARRQTEAELARLRAEYRAREAELEELQRRHPLKPLTPEYNDVLLPARRIPTDPSRRPARGRGSDFDPYREGRSDPN